MIYESIAKTKLLAWDYHFFHKTQSKMAWGSHMCAFPPVMS